MPGCDLKLMYYNKSDSPPTKGSNGFRIRSDNQQEPNPFKLADSPVKIGAFQFFNSELSSSGLDHSKRESLTTAATAVVSNDTSSYLKQYSRSGVHTRQHPTTSGANLIVAQPLSRSSNVQPNIQRQIASQGFMYSSTQNNRLDSYHT